MVQGSGTRGQKAAGPDSRFRWLWTWVWGGVGGLIDWGNRHAPILALLLGGPWAIYQFYFVEIVLPRTRIAFARVNASVHVEEHSGALVPVDCLITVTNPGAQDAEVFAAWYIVEGARLRRAALRDPEYRTEVTDALSKIDIAHRYVLDEHRQPVCNGRILNAIGTLAPGDEARLQFVAFVPRDSFQAVRLYAFVMTERAGARGLTHPWRVEGGGWVRPSDVVEWKRDGQGNFVYSSTDEKRLKDAGFRMAVTRAEAILPGGGNLALGQSLKAKGGVGGP
jgi:hypothetical protein